MISVNRRLVWKCVGKFLYMLFTHLPRSASRLWGGVCNRLRVFSTRMFIGHIGKDVTIEKNAVFSSKLEIGNYSGIGLNASINGKVIIGDYVMMGPNVKIYTINHNRSNLYEPMCFQGFAEEKPVKICDDVWIGDSVIILPGVTIGKGSIIGAGTVVTRDVPEYSIFAGNPGAVIKHR